MKNLIDKHLAELEAIVGLEKSEQETEMNYSTVINDRMNNEEVTGYEYDEYHNCEFPQGYTENEYVENDVDVQQFNGGYGL